MRVQTVPARREFPEVEVRLTGRITYDETRLATISAWVPGRIEDLFVDYTGVRVQEGDHMVELYSSELLAAQEELLQTLRSARELSDSSLESLREATRLQLESARERLRLWGLTPEQIAAVEERGTPEEHVTIYAPSSGIVIERNAEEGAYVQEGTPIFRIADLDSLWVQLDAYESDLEWLRYGQRVTFEVEAYPGEAFEGTIAFVDPVLDPRTRTVGVRLSIPNGDGRLKPDMFVRAVARAQVAGRGRVIDPSLAGKWISPMHPEIVADGPGACSICGMDLVPAEELGYVALDVSTAEAPIVIPVSAALVTGTRAIVYVEDPDAEEPTFEGREVVLGPRAGDVYVVRHGLAEGERVVFEGNFKIDSALQIQARPSMMAGPGDRPAGTYTLDEAQRALLQDVERALANVAESLNGDDEDRAREAFAALGRHLERTDASAFPADARPDWSEVAMRLSNDAFEGADARDRVELDAALAALRASVAELRARMGSLPEQPDPPGPLLPDTFRDGVDGLWAAYLPVHAALAGDDHASATDAAAVLLPELATLDVDGLSAETLERWDALATELSRGARRVAGSSTIEDARVAFEPLAAAITGAMELAGSRAAFVVHCPMAFDGRGASWLQGDEDVLNPYYGASMLRCGSVVDEIAARGGSGE